MCSGTLPWELWVVNAVGEVGGGASAGGGSASAGGGSASRMTLWYYLSIHLAEYMNE